jgi:hypothetical protein
MYQQQFSSRNVRRHRLASVALCGFWILLVSVASLAQSGRRLPDWNDKKTQPPPPAPDLAPEPSSRANKMALVVTGHLADIVSSSSILTTVVSDGLIERLNEGGSFSVTREQDMNRKEASDRAKGMSDGYVIWFQLETGLDQVGAGPYSQSQLYVSFAIYKSGTGKALTQGHVYQRPYGAGGGGPLPTPTGGTQLEYTLRRAGRETADRVMQALGKVAPPGH